MEQQPLDATTPETEQAPAETVLQAPASAKDEQERLRERCSALGIEWHEKAPEADMAAVGLLLPDVAVRLRVVPLRERSGRLVLAMVDPFDIGAADEVSTIVERRVQRVGVEAAAFAELIRRCYGTTAALLGRCAEQATRVALSLAILRCEWPAWPVVTAEVAHVAIDIVEASAWTIARSLRDNRAPSWDDVAGRIAYVENAIRKLADADGWVQRSALLRACQRLDAMGLDQILDRLVQEERLQVQKVATGGRNAIALRLTA
jgi:hypothetical protein